MSVFPRTDVYRCADMFGGSVSCHEADSEQIAALAFVRTCLAADSDYAPGSDGTYHVSVRVVGESSGIIVSVDPREV